MDWLIAIALLFPLVGGFLVAPLGRVLGKHIGWLALGFPVVSFASILGAAVVGGSQPSQIVEWSWIPSLGISLSFLVDGLSLIFGLIVSGVGILVFFYANRYFHGNEGNLNRFYAYLTLFMAAMLGTVFSDNLILLFIFWEFTGITSFLLIGLLHNKEASQAGARMALLVTVFTGLFTLVGIILVGLLSGTYSLAELMQTDRLGGLDPFFVNFALFLILLGAFGKSAQFPFHFWLPRAMEAPTPVSAYLHSATMVKLGVFLVARLFPVFHEAALWYPLVTLVGFGTMAWAAFLALRSNQLKAILAYSTVTQLGALIGFYGLSAHGGVFADFFHILDHVYYKAALFMIVGIITHSTGIKDIRELGGLKQSMPLMAVAAGIACASMAGLPLTMGFVSKELLLADMTDAIAAGSAVAVLALVLFSLAVFFKVAFTARFFFQIFTGPVPEGVTAHFHKPGILLQLPPLILVGISLILGLILPLAGGLLDYFTVAGLQTRESYLAYIHFNIDLVISLLLLAAGYWLYKRGVRDGWTWTYVPKLMRFDLGFEAFLKSFNRSCVGITKFVRSESPTQYLTIILGTMLLILGGYLVQTFASNSGGAFEIGAWSADIAVARVFAVVLIIIACLGVVFVRQWTTQLILLSIVGFLITFYFVLYRAPDLAMTQILVEVATLLLILLLLGRFPKSAQEREARDRKFGFSTIPNLLISGGIGLVITTSILIMNAVPPETRLGDAILAQTYDLAEGTNAVNTILVDFRGLDTLGEIAVLLIAVLGSLGLFFRYKRTDRERRQRALGAPGFGIFHKQPREGEDQP
ncbi:MAG: hydrogen gas-evolving membrane-bound hydrogenase subunit E [Puniceicoccaceae bacterium]